MAVSTRYEMKSVRSERLAHAVDGLYEAAAEPALWRSALHQLSMATGAVGAILHVNATGGSPAFVHSQGLDESFAEFLRDGWHLRNETVRRFDALGQGRLPVQTEASLFSADEYMRDPMHMEFLRPNGFGWFAGMEAIQSPRGNLTVSLQRSWKDEPFSKREVAALVSMLPHLRRVAHLALAVGTARAEGVLDSFSLLSVAAFLLDPSGRVCRLNDRAERLLGTDLSVVERRLAGRRPAVTAALAALAGRLVSGGPILDGDLPRAVRVPRTGGYGLIVYGAPLVGRARDVFDSAVAVVVALDLDANRTRSVLHLELTWGLTRAEAETAMALASGLSLHEVAVRRGVGLETVRSQVKSVGVKTGAHTRGAMVMLLNRMISGALDPG